jgi:hypothetical protein
MKKDPTIKTEDESDVITTVVNTTVEDDWDNINGDMVLF